MYEIELYEDENGYSVIAIYIKELQRKGIKNKESRIQFNKIVAYFVKTFETSFFICIL